jgi:hypothetical protein
MKAVEVLMEHGVPEERIIFINLVRTLKHSEGYLLSGTSNRYPHLKVSKRSARSIRNCEWYGSKLYYVFSAFQ